MHFHSLFISSFLLASTVLATNYSLFDTGIILNRKHNATFRTIEGGMKTQMVSGNVNDSVTAYVSLDSAGCSYPVFVGVTCTVVELESPSGTKCGAWYYVEPDNRADFPDFPINIGNTIFFGATAPYPYNPDADPLEAQGVRVFVQNSENSTLYRGMTFENYQPCGQRARWAVGYPPDRANPGYRPPLAHFGRLELPHPTAYGLEKGTYGPSDKMAQKYSMIYQNGSVIAFVEVEGSSIVVRDIRAANPN